LLCPCETIHNFQPIQQSNVSRASNTIQPIQQGASNTIQPIQQGIFLGVMVVVAVMVLVIVVPLWFPRKNT
jgi:hypothetical protein